MKNQIKLILVASLIFITIIACGSNTNDVVSSKEEKPVESNLEESASKAKPTKTKEPKSQPIKDTPTLEDDALSLMVLVFVGDYTHEEIKQKLDLALVYYGEEINEENYSRAGSVLVYLRNEYGIPEMDILDYMIRSYVAGVDISFPDMAALAALMIQAGDE